MSKCKMCEKEAGFLNECCSDECMSLYIIKMTDVRAEKAIAKIKSQADYVEVQRTEQEQAELDAMIASFVSQAKYEDEE